MKRVLSNIIRALLSLLTKEQLDRPYITRGGHYNTRGGHKARVGGDLCRQPYTARVVTKSVSLVDLAPIPWAIVCMPGSEICTP